MTDLTQLVTNSQRIAPTRTESVLKVRFVQYGRHRRLTLLKKNLLFTSKYLHVPHRRLTTLGVPEPTLTKLLRLVTNSWQIATNQNKIATRATLETYDYPTYA